MDTAGFIRANLPLTPVPGVPELRLHRAGPSSGLSRLLTGTRDLGKVGSPYWAYSWAGGLVLARHMLERPETVRDRRVLDLGSGSGLVGIAAAKAGARSVAAAETDPLGAAAIKLNAAANAVSVSVVSDDLLAGPPPAVDLVLAGDLFYEARLARRVTAFLDRCVEEGLEVLVGDPGRPFLPRDRLRAIADHAVPDVGDPLARPSSTSTVYRWEGRADGQAATLREPPESAATSSCFTASARSLATWQVPAA